MGTVRSQIMSPDMISSKDLAKNQQNMNADIESIKTDLAESAKKIPRINIVSYGAKANANYFNSSDNKWYVDSGFTQLANDDTQSIKDALIYMKTFVNATAYNRVILEFPSGMIWVSSSILIDAMQSVTWLGQGIDSTTLVFTGTGDMIDLGVVQDSPTNYWNGNAQGFQVSSMTLRNMKDDTPSNNGIRTTSAIADNGSGGVLIRNVRFKGFKYGFYGRMGSDFSKIVDCQFRFCDVGVYLGAGSQQVELATLNIFQCNEGIVMERAGQGKVDNCWFVDNYKSDISIEANTVLRSGLPTLSGTSNDLSWTIADCWFETGAGYNTNADHQTHILFKGDLVDGTPKGVKIVKPLLYSGTAGMGTKDGAKRYSFVRVEAGTNIEIEDLLIIGARIDVVVDTPSGFFPKITQYNTRTSDGYTKVPLWAYTGAAMVSYDFSRQILSAPSAGCFIELDNTTTGQNLQILNNGDNTVSFKWYDGTAWRERFKMDVMNGRIYMSSSLSSVSFASTMPTSGSYVQGDVVYNKGTDNNILLWKRLTTGSSHVLNTDWKVY